MLFKLLDQCYSYFHCRILNNSDLSTKHHDHRVLSVISQKKFLPYSFIQQHHKPIIIHHLLRLNLIL